ncbi:Spore germination protein [Wickerhamomyces ciferrii]|uniref:Spore germination protein n=1 Tax=Wickerhamomyces ciferrii (strain ATCC 14091 / BCRC 22168 / CBS 111 / JCM 3599 / NBRC 0793 / NRRL Y-1031 F-60-10) TaxID=1206466 RepID=K0KLU9_WICCF|nr:Spore germination protein [Wickerhamomyces ciferrii]CCH42103.1 Spore germination protein [Wickerhamomyces ciferrii]
MSTQVISSTMNGDSIKSSKPVIESHPFVFQFSEVEKAITNFTNHQPFNHHYAPNVHPNKNNHNHYNNRHHNNHNHNNNHGHNHGHNHNNYNNNHNSRSFHQQIPIIQQYKNQAQAQVQSQVQSQQLLQQQAQQQQQLSNGSLSNGHLNQQYTKNLDKQSFQAAKVMEQQMLQQLQQQYQQSVVQTQSQPQPQQSQPQQQYQQQQFPTQSSQGFNDFKNYEFQSNQDLSSPNFPLRSLSRNSNISNLSNNLPISAPTTISGSSFPSGVSSIQGQPLSQQPLTQSLTQPIIPITNGINPSLESIKTNSPSNLSTNQQTGLNGYGMNGLNFGIGFEDSNTYLGDLWNGNSQKIGNSNSNSTSVWA